MMQFFHSKLSFLPLLCLLLFCTEAKGAEGNDPLVTLNMKEKPLQEVLKEITRQTEVNFSYESSLVKHLPPVSLKVADKPLSDCLRLLFGKLPLTYHRTGNFIILKKKPKRVTISGFVRDKASSESLIGASVYDRKTRQGTTSNTDGFFSLTLEAGCEADVEISYVGYDNFRYSFSPLEKDTILPALLTTHQQLDEVVITGDHLSSNPVQTAQMGKANLSRETIKQTPVLFGEADIIKTLQTLPGVSAGTAGLAGMYVRGGNGDDNLYMIEGNPLYQVNHVGGLFSAFNSDAVKDVEFFKSAFPARYGGRLSSVVDVHTKDGNMKEYHGSAMLGLTSGSFNLEGPIVKDRTSFNIALRRSWLDVLTIPAEAIWNATRDEGENKIIAHYAFTDLNLKISHTFNERSRGYTGLYYGNDYLKGGTEEDKGNGYEDNDVSHLRWGNIMAFAGWSYVFNKQLFGNLNAAYTRYASTLKRETSEGSAADRLYKESSIQNGIEDISARANFDYRPAPSHHLHFGANYIYHRFHPEKERLHTDNGSSVVDKRTPHSTLPAHELGVYAEEDWKLGRIVRLNAGLRFGIYSIDGKSYTSLEPRFSSRFLLNPQLSLKASYARMSQYVHQVNESYISLPTDTWMPVSRKLCPMVSDQLSAGVYYNTSDHGYSFSVEGYYKWMNHLMEYKDNYQFLPASSTWEDKLTQGKGRSYGIEFTARKETGKVTGWAGYTLSWNDRQFVDINGGNRFPAKFDNRHKFNIVANWKVSPKVELTGSWTYMTGNRITVSFENYQYLGQSSNGNSFLQTILPGSEIIPPFLDEEGLDYYTTRNNFRLPAYHRLDVGINIYRPKKKGRMGIWNVSIYNAYCYMAPIGISKRYWYNLYPSATDSRTNCYFEKLGLIPIIPSVSYTYKF